jgi:hypothetical protein
MLRDRLLGIFTPASNITSTIITMAALVTEPHAIPFTSDGGLIPACH